MRSIKRLDHSFTHGLFDRAAVRLVVTLLLLGLVGANLVPAAPDYCWLISPTATCPDLDDPPVCDPCGNCSPSKGRPRPPSTGPNGSSPGGRAGGGAQSLNGNCSACVSPGQLTGSSPPGMPVYFISQPYCNLRIEDSPGVLLNSALGPGLEWHLSYRQRGYPPESGRIFTVGTNWSCSLRSYLADSSGTGEGPVYLHRYSSGHIKYAPGYEQPWDGSILRTNGGFHITYPDGTVESYGQPFTNDDSTVFYFISSRTDPSGNSLTWNYAASTNLLLQSISDPSGQSLLIFYDDPVWTNAITRVVDPVGGRTNTIYYNNECFPTNIIDSQGLQSQFTYSPGARESGWITSMVTPYGTTSFEYGGCDYKTNYFNTPTNGPNRWAKVTLPNGGHELYLFRQDCSTFLTSSNWVPPNTYPEGNYFDTLDQQNRNSFHWGPLQYTGLSTNNPDFLIGADYKIAELRHWLMQTPDFNAASEGLSLERLPSPDGTTEGAVTWYDYNGKSVPNAMGDSILPRFVAWVRKGSVL